ncbi:HU family DNA-binding protein [Candidatus Fukatsuia anoeciicola]|uniref:HU family DNA-binding protein n=1 Tax=Candidatus Fukatsuia anoeciicola TaxID=2994492 RepID=UPI00346407CA
MGLTKDKISENLLNKFKILNQEITKILVDLFFSEIRYALQNGEEVKLCNFGSFKLRDKPTRPGRNPKTSEPKLITARRVVTFRPSDEFRKQVINAAPKK